MRKTHPIEYIIGRRFSVVFGTKHYEIVERFSFWKFIGYRRFVFIDKLGREKDFSLYANQDIVLNKYKNINYIPVRNSGIFTHTDY
jgi:hypothetical protein